MTASLGPIGSHCFEQILAVLMWYLPKTLQQFVFGKGASWFGVWSVFGSSWNARLCCELRSLSSTQVYQIQ